MICIWFTCCAHDLFRPYFTKKCHDSTNRVFLPSLHSDTSIIIEHTRKEGGRETGKEGVTEGEREGDRNKGTICIRERRGRGREECKWSFLQSHKWLGEANIKWFTCLNTALQCTGVISDPAPLGAKHMYF